MTERKTGPTAARDHRTVLYYGRVLLSFVLIVSSLLLGLIYLAFTSDEPFETHELAMMVAFIVFLVLGCAEGIFTKGCFDRSGIQFRSIWKGKRCLEWSQLVKVDFDPIMEGHELEFDDGRKILISRYLKGSRELLTQLRAMGYIF